MVRNDGLKTIWNIIKAIKTTGNEAARSNVIVQCVLFIQPSLRIYKYFDQARQGDFPQQIIWAMGLAGVN